MAERGAWTYDDVVTENAALTTTGGRVWPAAYRLAEYLEHELDSMFPHGHAPTVLELGAGCGWLGLVLARNMAACECICLTEQEEGGGLEWLAHNVRVNKGRLPGGERIVCAPCDWSWYMPQQRQQQQPPAQQLQQQHGQPQLPGAHTSSSPTPQQQQQQQQLVCVKPAVPCDDGAHGSASAVERPPDSASAQSHAASSNTAATNAVAAAAALAAEAAEALALEATEATTAAVAAAPAVAAAEAAAGAAVNSQQPGAAPLAAQLKDTWRLSPDTSCVQQQRQNSQAMQPSERMHHEHHSQEDASPSLYSSAHISAHTCANAPEDAAAASLPDRAVGRLCPATAKPWDLLIGSDLIYTEQGCRMLPQVMRQLATPGHTRVLYCHTRHRFDHLDLLLMEELARAGLVAREVRERGMSTPPPSPPPLTELFPDFRIAVYSVSFASAS